MQAVEKLSVNDTAIFLPNLNLFQGQGLISPSHADRRENQRAFIRNVRSRTTHCRFIVRETVIVHFDAHKEVFSHFRHGCKGGEETASCHCFCRRSIVVITFGDHIVSHGQAVDFAFVDEPHEHRTHIQAGETC